MPLLLDCQFSRQRLIREQWSLDDLFESVFSRLAKLAMTASWPENCSLSQLEKADVNFKEGSFITAEAATMQTSFPRDRRSRGKSEFLLKSVDHPRHLMRTVH